MPLYLVYFVFFFKQKTAYEMRISDWSSDVCSSDLGGRAGGGDLLDGLRGEVRQPHDCAAGGGRAGHRDLAVGVDRLYAGGRDDHRQRDLLAQHRGAQLALGVVPGDMGCEAEVGEAGLVVTDRLTTLGPGDQRAVRSEEHTSELQSLMRISYAV